MMELSHIARDRRLSLEAVGLALVLAHVDPETQVQPEELAEERGITVARLAELLNELQRHGHLRARPSDGRVIVATRTNR